MAAGSAHPVIEVRPLDTTMYWSNSQLASHGRAMVSEEAAMRDECNDTLENLPPYAACCLFARAMSRWE